MSAKRPRTLSSSHSSSTSSTTTTSPPPKSSRTIHSPNGEATDPHSSHPFLCTLPPTCQRRPTPIAHSKDLEAHYARCHAQVCAEVGCGCVFPDDRLLALHQTECHDPLAAIRKDRGEKIFACHLASCPRLFSTPKTRRLHLIQAHGFPKEYFFAVTNKGIGGLLRKWGDGASMIRGQWKPREKKTDQGVQGGSESADDSDDSESDDSEGSEVMEVDGKDGYDHADTTPKASARATRTLDDTDMDKIADSLSSLSLVPASVRFGRGGKTTGFAYNSTAHTVHPVDSHLNGSNTPRDAHGPQQNGQDERRHQDRRSGSDGGKGRANPRARGAMRVRGRGRGSAPGQVNGGVGMKVDQNSPIVPSAPGVLGTAHPNHRGRGGNNLGESRGLVRGVPGRGRGRGRGRG
ncbi:hypothetical protein PTI98_008036 [Pleurotus ostreatus]|nr:hypothetical protein PTI98_008036 [Pleurotus ostreatus]